jgi:outer membrane protein OmpA-like peptidoglycan-associated protein
VSFNSYLPYSLNFDLKIPDGQTHYHIDIPLNPINSTTENVLANVFFDLNKSSLRQESAIELKNLAEFLRKNPNLKIELGGHTDTRGNAVENLALSTARAKTVYDYLISAEGIDPKRLTFVGYGETMPLMDDIGIAKLKNEIEIEKAHQKNRRTVYKIIK